MRPKQVKLDVPAENVIPLVTAGETYRCDSGGPKSKLVDLTIAPSCGAKSGVWMCMTCDEVFPHDWARDSHADTEAEHRFSWVCPEHGPEVP